MRDREKAPDLARRPQVLPLDPAKIRVQGFRGGSSCRDNCFPTAVSHPTPLLPQPGSCMAKSNPSVLDLVPAFHSTTSRGERCNLSGESLGGAEAGGGAAEAESSSTTESQFAKSEAGAPGSGSVLSLPPAVCSAGAPPVGTRSPLPPSLHSFSK